MSSKPYSLVAVIFFLSGAAGLIYEIVWEKLLESYFGVTIISITLIVAAYMGGLGLGSLLGGWLAKRVHSRLLLYGTVEVGIGTFGVFSPMIINWVGHVTAGSPYVLVFVLSFVLLLIPTVLMGMTLPLLSQALVTQVETSGQVIGLLYGINTLGAAFGAILAAYFLIGAVGFIGTSTIAAGVNILVGLVAISAFRYPTKYVKSFPASKKKKISLLSRLGLRTILVFSFLIGFIGLGYEMLWMRVLLIINKNTAYGFPTILAVFLSGLALGSYFWGRMADRTKDPVGLFWKVELGVAISVALAFLTLWWALEVPTVAVWLQENFSKYQNPPAPYAGVDSTLQFSKKILVFGIFNYLKPILAMVLIPSFIMGGGLTILDRIAIDNPEVAGNRVGSVHLANIMGSVLGTLTISFIFFPSIGSELTLKLLVLLSLIFPALYSFIQIKQVRTVKTSKPLILLSVTVIIAAFLLPGKGMFYKRLFETAVGSPVILQEYGDAVLTLTLSEDTKAPTYLWIGGEVNSDYPPAGFFERRALACAGANHPKRILIIGLGGGNTAYFLENIPGVEKIVVVELIQNLDSFLEENVTLARIALEDARIQYIADDGRRYLYAHPQELFDLIIIDPLRSYTAGHDNLYSSEAMRLYQSHISENGVFCEWLDENHILTQTTASVFPEADYFSDFIVASNQPIRYDLSYMEKAYDAYIATASKNVNPDIVARLEPTTVLSRFFYDQDQILATELGTPILTDNNPWLEYYLLRPPIQNPYSVPNEEFLSFVRRIFNCDYNCQGAIINKHH